jgi:hypothetical protein
LFKTGIFLSKEKLNAILPNQETALIFGCGSVSLPALIILRMK